MDLILWRHAQAQAHVVEDGSAASFAEDLARALTPKGDRQAERMAAWLNQRLTDTTRVLVSPAKRTQQTAQALGRFFKTVATIAPDASVDDLLAAARWPHAKDPVLLVGHQPTLGLLASRLLSGQDLPWTLRKGAVWWLRGREREGQLEVTLHAVQSPDFL
ncbi:MAG: histidine phosphatase family protein [Leptothrix sp. (in: Bacteria)]|nr:histidine phosphatase family protein [Leptothrix sp. (in: b-proteobacteria)]